VDEIKELGKKSSVVFLGNILGKLLSSISIIVIGRLLGATVYGEFVYIVSFLSLFIVITKMGMHNSIIYFLSKNTLEQTHKKSILSFSILLSIIISIFVIIVSYACKEFIIKNLINNLEHRELFLLLIPTVLLSTILAILEGALKAMRKVKEFVFINSIFNPVNKLLIVIIFTVFLKINNYYSLVLSLYIYLIMAIVYCFIKLMRYGMVGKISPNYKHKDFIIFSLPLLLTGVANTISTNIDKYMIGCLINVEQVGVYRIALQFGTIASFALVAVNTVFASMISTIYHDNRLKDLKNMYKITTKWITIFNLMIFGFVIIFSKDIMKIAGEEFVIGSSALIIISIGGVLNSAVGSVGLINIMTGYSKYNFISIVIAVIFNVILNFLLIKDYGINGAAIATASALLIKNIFNFYFMHRNLKMHPYDNSYVAFPIIMGVAAFTTLIISNLIHINFFIRLVICGMVYSVIFLFLIYKFAMSEKELNIIKAEINKKINRA